MGEDNFLKKLKYKLNCEFYFMNDEWLRDCVGYYLNHHRNPKEKEVLDFVKIQWLLCDLREMNNINGSLPCNLHQQKSIVLTGNFILQMREMYDISISKYKQLERIRKTQMPEVDPSEAEREEKWEPAKKRMMQLKLTDGKQEIIGIEYKTIPLLNNILIPGYKLLIKGPVKCRKGVLLLKEENLEGIGGEVGCLLVTDALENVLARALNLPENPDPYNEKSTKPKTQDEVKPVEEITIESNLFDEDFDINLDEVRIIENSTKNDKKSKKEQSDPKKRTSERFTFRESIQTKNIGEDSNKAKQKNRGSYEERFTDDDDFLLAMIDENEFRDEVNAATEKKHVGSKTQPKKDLDHPIVISDDDLEADEPVARVSLKRQTSTSSPKSWENKASSQEKTQKPSSSFIGRKRQADFISISPDRSSNLGILERSQKPSFINETRSDPKTPEEKCSPKRMTSSSNDKKNMPHVSKSPSLIAGKRSAVFSPIESKVLKKGKIERKITDFTIKEKSPEPPKICDFIREFVNDSTIQNTFKTVRGRIENLGRLSKNGTSWILEAIIYDKTGKLEASFSNEVLENILGFGVLEFSKKKKLKKSNPEIEHELRTSFRNAEEKLKTLDALLVLELFGNEKPKVRSIKDLTEEQKAIIDKSVKKFLETKQ